MLQPAGSTTLRQACSPSGGIARADDLARLLEDCHRGDFVSLARLIARRDVFAFDWRGSLWVPMFQFDLRDLSIRLGTQRVLAELHTVLDAWTLAVWFVQPNGWLQGKRPMDLLDDDPDRVVRAARVDHFVSDLNLTREITDRRHP